MQYFNYISQEHEDIETANDFYLIFDKNEKKEIKQYKFIVSPEITDYIQRDAVSGSDEYFHITKTQVHENESILFPNNYIRDRPLSCRNVIDIFGFDPRVQKPAKFGTGPLQQITTAIEQLLRYATRTTKQAAKDLANLAQNPRNQNAIKNANGIPALISLLSPAKNLLIKQNAAIALAHLAESRINQEAIRDANGIPALITLLSPTENLRIRRSAAIALTYLAQSRTNRNAIRMTPCTGPILSTLTHLMSPIYNSPAICLEYLTMSMFEELQNELKNELYTKDENGLYVRLEPVARVKANSFFPVAGNSFFPPVPVMQDDDEQADVHNVCSLDSFQHLNDFSNDLRGILITPLVCNTLSQKHALKCFLELNLTLINIISLSPDRASHSFFKAGEEFFYALYYQMSLALAIITLPAAFTLRCLLSLLEMSTQWLTPEEQQFGMPCPG